MKFWNWWQKSGPADTRHPPDGSCPWIRETKTYIICPKCMYVSHHPKDIEEKYCNRCSEFHADMVIPPKKPRDPTGW